MTSNVSSSINAYRVRLQTIFFFLRRTLNSTMIVLIERGTMTIEDYTSRSEMETNNKKVHIIPSFQYGI